MQAMELARKRPVDQAIEAGATRAKIISVTDIAVARWVRHKCQFGCPDFGKNFTCPPYSPTPEETTEVLKGYRRALLVEFSSRHTDGGEDELGRTHLHSLLFNLERQFFLDGYYGAVAYGWGHCRLCPECPAGNIENPSPFHKKECLNPRMARPSMEASGMDVFGTVRRAGWDIHVVQDRPDTFTTFGLVLLQ